MPDPGRDVPLQNIVVALNKLADNLIEPNGYVAMPNAVVEWRPDPGTTRWKAFSPGGALICDSGAVGATTTTKCLQEALNYAQANAAVFHGYGGDYTSIALLSSTVAFPIGRGNHYLFEGVTLQYSGNLANDMFTVDTSDFVRIEMNNTQIIYPGNAAAWHFLPARDNGEAFAGFTSSSFKLGNIAIVNPSTFLPESTHGIGIRVSAPALGLGLANGNGLFINNYVSAAEVNGGLVGLRLDDPGAGSPITANFFDMPALHTQGTYSLQVGVANGGPGLIYSNQFRANLSPVATATAMFSSFGGLSTAGGNYYDLTLNGAATTRVLLGANAYSEVINTPSLVFAANLTDNSTAHTSVIHGNGGAIRAGITPGASPWIYQNPVLRPLTVAISGGTVSLVALSADGITYDNYTYTSPLIFTLPANAFMKVTYTGAPTVLSYY